MNSFFNKRELELLNGYFKEIKRNAPDDTCVNDYMQEVLMNHVEGLARSEAEHIVNEISAGIDEFNLEFNHCVDRKHSIERLINRSIAENHMDTPTAISFLSSIIASLRLDRPSQGQLSSEEIQKTMEEIINCSTTEEYKEQLIKDACESILNRSTAAIDDQLAQRIIDQPWSVETADALSQAEAEPIYQGISLYIAASRGELDNLKTPQNPRQLGISVAAGLKANQLTEALVAGKISKSEWVDDMVTNISVLMAVSIIAVASVAVVVITAGLLIAVTMCIGSGLLEVLGTCLVCGFSAFALMGIFGNYEELLEWCDDFMQRTLGALPEILRSLPSHVAGEDKHVVDVEIIEENESEIEEMN